MTKSIPNYVCVKCARGFTTSAAGWRHVANVESGNGYIVTESDYRVGILTRKIPPPAPKLGRQFRRRPAKSAIALEKEAFRMGYYHRLGELKCEEQFGKLESTKKLAYEMYEMMNETESKKVSSDAAGGSTNMKLNAFIKKLIEANNSKT